MVDRTAYSETVMLALERQREAILHIDTVAAAPSLTLTEAWQVVTEALSEALQAARVSVWFLDRSKEVLTCADLFLASDNHHESGLELLANQYPSYFKALTQERAIDAHEALTDPRTIEFAEGYLSPLGIASMLDAPIRREGQVVGVVCVEHKGHPRRWRPDEVLCAGAAGDQVGKILAAHERREAERTLALREEQVRQMQKLEAIGQLAGGIAHDFNNVLSGIIGSIEIVEREVSVQNTKAHAALSLMRRSGDRATGLVSKLLSFSRKSRALTAPFDLHRILDDALMLFQRVGGANIELLREFSDDSIVVHGDPVDIQMAVLNLCINAGDAMPDGGTLRVTTQIVTDSSSCDTLDADSHTQNKRAAIRFIDNGVGITPAVLDKIYEPFFTTKSHDKGTGLGLSAVFAIVSNHEGTIDVASNPGEGTTFTIILPLSNAPPQAIPLADTTYPSDIARHILVVDDEDLLRKVTGLLLEQMGHTVTVAIGGEHATTMVRDNPGKFDLILMDMNMPGMSGEECFKQIRNHDTTLPVLICTGYANSDSVDRVIERGAAGVLHKPYSLSQLSARIAELLGTESSGGKDD